MSMLHTTGEEVFTDHRAGTRSQLPSPWYIGLFNDTTDQLTDDDTYAAITTDPDDVGPIEVTWPDDTDTEQLSAGTQYAGVYVMVVTADLVFDVTNAADGDVVDSYYVAADFRSQRLGQASAQRNLLWTGDITDGPYDLGADVNETFPVVGVRLGED